MGDKSNDSQSVATGDAGNEAADMNDVVLNTWKEFDLENLRTTLDADALKMAEHQERSSKGRRKLMEGTKAFKQLKDPADQAKEFTPLLKSYQEEIDSLSKRAKFSESCFLSVFQKLYEAPDPVPALAAASENTVRVMELEAANRKLQLELDEFIAESAKLKNQQVTVRRLEERNRQLELQMQDKVKDVVQSTEKALAEEQKKSLESMKEREKALLAQLSDANQTVGNLSHLHEVNQNQIFTIKSQSDEKAAAKQAELELLASEIEGAEQRQQDLEREKMRLTNALKELEETMAKRGGEDDDDLQRLRQEIEAKDRVIAQLHAELAEADATAAANHERSHSELKAARASAAESKDQVSQLQHQLKNRPSVKQVQDLQAQVKALQALGYNLVDEAGGSGWDDPDSGATSDLEALLLAKNRKMEHEVTTAKNRLQEQQQLTDQAEKRVQELEAKVEEQSRLLRQLEEDMARVGQQTSPARTGPKPADDAEEGWDDSSRGGALETSLKQGEGSGRGEGADRSVVNVVAEQRDRFRKRCLELEEAARAARMAHEQQAAHLQTLKQDNVTLFEKIKFLQAYQRDGTTGRGGRRDVEAGAEREVMSKYSGMYEAGMNPFAEFKGRERDDSVKKLRVHDRVTLSTSRLLLGNKYTRAFLFFYTITLHLLVFTVLWRMSLHSMSVHHGMSTEELCTRHHLMLNMQQLFSHADHDHNGVLDESEFEAAIEEETESLPE